jgi:hypothetical protein
VDVPVRLTTLGKAFLSRRRAWSVHLEFGIPVTLLSLQFSRALARGRASRPEPASRANLLAMLLRKRAAAHNAGAEDLEALLRDQIRWALPIERHLEDVTD